MTTTTSRRPAAKRAPAKAAPRKRAVASTQVTATDEALAPRFEPLDLDAEDDLPEDTAPLFVLDGVTYEVPLYPSAALALEYIEQTTTIGIGAANLWALRQLIGDAGYVALTTGTGRRKLTGKNLARIVDLAVGIVLGALEDDTTGPLGRG